MKILLVGCGKLGKALLSLWVSNQALKEIVVVQPSLKSAPLFNNTESVLFVPEFQRIPAEFVPDVVVVAVKPQQLETVLPDYKRYSESSVFLSVVAATSIDYLRSLLGKDAKICRAMPNLAITHNSGIVLLFSSVNIRPMTDELFNKNAGLTLWVDKEEQIDILTPLLSSGLAYFYALGEAISSCVSDNFADMPDVFADQVAKIILCGSAFKSVGQTSLKELQAEVASKGGITEVALEIIVPEFKNTINKAYIAAMKRLEELKR